MKGILVNYNHQPEDWWLEYGIELDVMYDRSDDGITRTFAATYQIRKTENLGDVDYDKLGYLIEYYDRLPEIFLWGKSNLFKYVEPEYLKKALETKEFTPLLKFDHRTYSDRFGVVNRYSHIYEERADSWFFNNSDLSHQCPSWEAWCIEFGLPQTPFIPFAPGGSYILTRERVHRYSRDFYIKMRDTLPYAQHPAEAHACERSYYLLWK